MCVSYADHVLLRGLQRNSRQDPLYTSVTHENMNRIYEDGCLLFQLAACYCLLACLVTQEVGYTKPAKTEEE